MRSQLKIIDIQKFLNSSEKKKIGNLMQIVDEVLDRKVEILDIVKDHPTPFYLIDRNSLKESIETFKYSFVKNIPNCRIFYAMKSNDHPYILKQVVKTGFGVDASSGRELLLALENKAEKILFSGPAKTDEELGLALDNSDKVTINMDSFTELKRLGELTNKLQVTINAGVRIYTKYHGRWNKFGINLEELNEFWKESKKYEYINLIGIQCHMSWNESVEPYQNMIKVIGQYLGSKLDKIYLNDFQFIDLGGGFTPQNVEGDYPWATPQGKVNKIINEYFDQEAGYDSPYYVTESVSIDTYSTGISKAIKEHLKMLPQNVSIYFEPGRIICSKSMHILLKVMDIKNDFAILDGGTNITGWEKVLNSYSPLINLSNPSKKERKMRMYGSLCTPDDIWGYYCYSSKFEIGDIIVAPYRGAYTYSFSQDFIKPIPETYYL